ncbi:MAG: HNH endonuclease [Thermoanaerobaculia bacterium]|nr:MAG: HNH endonuclease [Thermoanaerobaculia bacterium]
MRYWWVNQNQTFRQEFRGGYLWSPKRRADGARHPYYESMREVAPGDLVLSFADTRIRAFGIAKSHAYENPKPAEFGSAGRNWEAVGWRVDVAWQEVPTVVRPVEWMELLRPLLPKKYSPLLPDGRGVQSVYLTELPKFLALTLAHLVGSEVEALARAEIVAEPLVEVAGHPELVLWEEHLRQRIEADPAIPETEREALVLARRGQGLFRERVQAIERRCRVTGVDRSEHLRASHSKPWRDSDNAERLDGENGLLLTPSIDHLFDRGFISFTNAGRLIVSPVAHRPSLARMGVPIDRELDVGPFLPGQARYLEYHRDQVLLASRIGS